MTSQTLPPLFKDACPVLASTVERDTYQEHRGDTVIAYIAGKEMARGHATSQGHVRHNQETYLSVTDFYTDSIHRISSQNDDWWNVDKQCYNNCYRTVQDLQDN